MYAAEDTEPCYAKALRWYIVAPVFVLLLGGLLTVQQFFHAEVVNIVFIALVSLLTVLVTGKRLYHGPYILPPRDDGTKDHEKAGLLDKDESHEQKPRERVYYLDNIKTALTFIVALHHVVCSTALVGWPLMIGYDWSGESSYLNLMKVILGVNQSYFMWLFFFISGYVTPRSLEKYGRWNFLWRRYKRLGFPYLFFFFCISPFASVAGYFFAFEVPVAENPINNFNFFFLSPGPMWYVGWLLLLSTVYAIIHGPSITITRPKWLYIWYMLVCVLIMGPLQLAVALLPVGGSFMFMPLVQGSLPFDLFMFAFGIIVRNNNWLSEPLPFYVLAMCVGVGAPVLYISLATLASYRVIALDIEKPEIGIPMEFFVCFMGAAIAYMIMAFGQRHMNRTNKLLTYLAGAAYGAYILHPIFIYMPWMGYVAILQATGTSIEFGNCGKDAEDLPISCSFLTDAQLWGAFFFIMFFMNALLWPFCILLKTKTPLRHII